MGYRFIDGVEPGGRFFEAPLVVVDAVRDGPIGLELSFSHPSEELGDAGRLHVRFLDVFEYRWIAEGLAYYPTDPDARESALIEILDSELTARLLDGGRYAAAPRGERFGGTVDEALLRHFRISFEGHGTYDVVCIDLSIQQISAD